MKIQKIRSGVRVKPSLKAAVHKAADRISLLGIHYYELISEPEGGSAK
jgi:hypothetical protein